MADGGGVAGDGGSELGGLLGACVGVAVGGARDRPNQSFLLSLVSNTRPLSAVFTKHPPTAP